MTKRLDGASYFLSSCPGRRIIGVAARQEQEDHNEHPSHRPLPNAPELSSGAGSFNSTLGNQVIVLCVRAYPEPQNPIGHIHT